MSAKLPEKIDRYRVLRAIARGGMAEVYEVEDPASGDHIALKLLLNTESELERFNREYEMMNCLNHPNVVRVYHYGLVGDLPWITMELIEGTPVQSYVKSLGKAGSQPRTEEVIRIGHDLARALDHIHTRGLLHRDLKSANVLILPDGRVKLLDFGAARFVQGAKPITAEGEFLGTFAYASPEQIQGLTLDHRCDLYAFGCLLYRMLCARLPFRSNDYQELARMQVFSPPPRPAERVPNVDPDLEALILQLLEKEPDKRPESGDEVARRLEKIAGKSLYGAGPVAIAENSHGALAGRENQIAKLRRFVTACEPGSVACIFGSEGSGRERLIERAVDDIRERGWSHLQHTITSRRPIEPLLDTMTELSRDFEASGGGMFAEAMAAIDTLRKHGVSSNQEERMAHGHALAALLHERTNVSKQPLALVLTNADLGGEPTALFVLSLSEALAARKSPVMLLLDSEDSGMISGSPLREHLPKVHRVKLPPLDERETARLVGSLLLRRPPPMSLARRIHRASGGLPLFVEEVVRTMLEAGQVRARGHDDNGLEWTLSETEAIPIPPAARLSLTDQLEDASAEHRRILEALAMLAGDTSAELIAHALERSPKELLPSLRDLSERGWITLSRPSRVQWRQPLMGEVVLSSLQATRRNVILRRILPVLSRMPTNKALIQLLLDTGYAKVALERTTAWVERQLAEGRPITALDLLETVMPVVDQSDDLQPPQKAALYLLHTRTLLEVRPTSPDTGKAMIKARALSSGDEQAVQLALAKANSQRAIGHYPNYRKHLEEAWTLIEKHPTPVLAASIADSMGRSLILAGKVGDARRWHALARKAAQATDDPVRVARAEAGVALWQYTTGELAQAQARSAEATRILQERGDLVGLSMALPVWLHCIRQRGRFSEGIDVIHHELRRMHAAESPMNYVQLLLAYGWLEADIGRLGRAQELLDELGASLGSGMHLDLRLQADLLRGRILMESGATSEANQILVSVFNAAENAELLVMMEQARAYLGATLWDDQQYSEAERLFKESMQGLGQLGDLPGLLEACMTFSKSTRGVVSPEDVFGPVSQYVQRQPAEVAKLEWLLSIGRHQRKFGQESTATYTTARENLLALSEHLNPTDQAALRVHTWSREIGIGFDAL